MFANKAKRNRAIKEEFAAICKGAGTEDTKPNKGAIYRRLGFKYNLSAVQVRHIIKGYTASLS